MQSISNGAAFELKRMFPHRDVNIPEQLPTVAGSSERGERDTRASDPAPMTIRILRTFWLPYSQRYEDTLQQWIDGEWRNVGIVSE